ncbi:MAG: transposase [Promethearchaeota archaeon]
MIRNLYCKRWQIEIAFREIKRLGISVKTQNRDVRLGIMGVKSLLYNI